MSECLGLYIEKNLIKYAKVSKERDNIKVEAFGIKTYDKLEEVLERIVQETYSFKIPLSVNVSDEMYNYYNVFSMLNKKDIEKSIITEFEFLCGEKGINKNVLETRYFSVPNIEDSEKIRTVHIAVNKTELARKNQQISGYKLRNMSPMPISITNLIDIGAKDNIAIVNIEEKTSITIIVKGQVYKIDVFEDGMKEIFEKINIKENSYAKSYEVCKNTTIYTMDGKNLQLEENEYLEDIMPTLYNIVSKTKKIVLEEKYSISKLYITGSGAIINNIDLYFQENIKQIKCEILKPYFLQTELLRLNMKEYIEANSAIAMALQGLGEGLKGINFKELDLFEKVELPNLGKIEITKKNNDSQTKISSWKNISIDLGGSFDRIEMYLLRIVGTLVMLTVLYSIFSVMVSNQIQEKEEQVAQVSNDINRQINAVNKDINDIKVRTSEYVNAVNNLKNLNEHVTEKYRTRNAIPNLLNRLMSSIPKNVQLTSIQNTSDTHIVIKAQSENYEQLGMFKAQIIVDGILDQVKSDTSIKEGGIVKVTIEGELP